MIAKLQHIGERMHDKRHIDEPRQTKPGAHRTEEERAFHLPARCAMEPFTLSRDRRELMLAGFRAGPFWSDVSEDPDPSGGPSETSEQSARSDLTQPLSTPLSTAVWQRGDLRCEPKSTQTRVRRIAPRSPRSGAPGGASCLPAGTSEAMAKPCTTSRPGPCQSRFNSGRRSP